MKKYCLLLICLVSLSAFSQTSKDKKIFLDSLNNETTEGNHKYYRIITDINLDKKQYEISDYYLNNQIKRQGISKDKNGDLKIGLHKEFYESGKLKSHTNYSEDYLSTGPHSSFYENGNKECEGEYVRINNIDEKPTLKVTSYWDANGNQKVTEGTGFMSEKSEFETSRGKIANGFKEGVWTGVNLRYKLQFADQYESGNFIGGVSKDAENIEFVYLKIEKQPEFPGGVNGFSSYVRHNYKLPDVDESIKGQILLEFIVGKEERIRDIKVIKSLGKEFDIEAVKMLSSCKGPWISGEIRGIKQDFKYNLPINISINVDNEIDYSKKNIFQK